MPAAPRKARRLRFVDRIRLELRARAPRRLGRPAQRYLDRRARRSFPAHHTTTSSSAWASFSRVPRLSARRTVAPASRCCGIWGDPRLTPGSCAVIDLRNVRSVGAIHHDDIRAVAKTRIARVGRCALVAQEPAVFGICRMWAAFRDLADESQAMEVFRSVLAAEAWLDHSHGAS